MLLEPGDVLTSKGDYATFQVQFNEESPRWWPCHLAHGGVWLVLDVERADPYGDKIVAKLLSVTDFGCKPWWVEGGLDEWCTLDKLS